MNTLQELNQFQKDAIREARQSGAFKVYTVVISLATARTEQDPFVIGFPFKTIAFENATDNTTNVQCKFNSNDQGVTPQTFKDNAVVTTNKMWSGAYLYWSAQPGATITVTVYVDAEYTTGSLKNSGTVAVSAITTPVPLELANTLTLSSPAITAGTATQVSNASSTIKNQLIQNDKGVDIYVGKDNTVTTTGSTRGIRVAAGASYSTEYQGALWVICGSTISAGDIMIATETKV